MNRVVKIGMILLLVALLTCGPLSCGKKGPPVPKNPFSNEVLSK